MHRTSLAAHLTASVLDNKPDPCDGYTYHSAIVHVPHSASLRTVARLLQTAVFCGLNMGDGEAVRKHFGDAFMVCRRLDAFVARYDAENRPTTATRKLFRSCTAKAFKVSYCVKHDW